MKSNALNYRPIQLGVGAIIFGITGFILCSSNELQEGFVNPSLFMLLTLMVGLICFAFNHKTLMLICFTCCAGLCISLKEGSNNRSWPESLVKVAHFNLSGETTNSKSITQKILSSEADILSIQEIPPSLLSKLHNQLIVAGYKNFHSQNGITPTTRELVVYSKYDMVLSQNTSQMNSPLLTGKLKIPSNNQYKEIHFISTRFFSPNLLQSNISLPNYAPFFVFGNPYSNAVGPKQSISIPVFTDPIFYSNHFNCISFERINCTSKQHLGVMGVYQLKNQSDGVPQIPYKEL